MLRLFRIGSIAPLTAGTVSAFQEDTLLDLRFDLGLPPQDTERALTKFRLCRKSGAVASMELRAGRLLGVELLGLVPGRWDVRVERFSEEFDTAREIPLLGIELDGGNSRVRVDISAIDQSFEFSTRFASAQNLLEISFDEFHHASDFGAGMAMYNRHGQLAGVRVRLP